MSDHLYLLWALNGGCAVSSPEARKSLQRLGYMTPAKLRERYGGNPIPHGMVLTKKGRKRAEEIQAQLEAEYKVSRNLRNCRGNRGAPWPKSWKISKLRGT